MKAKIDKTDNKFNKTYFNNRDFYKNAITITDIEQLAGAMTEQLARLFDKKEKKLKLA